MAQLPSIRAFGPFDRSPTGTIELKVEELEALRLVDIEGLSQEEAAGVMGISKKSFWLDLKRAREKLASALIEGKVLRIRGGSYVIRGRRGPPHEEED